MAMSKFVYANRETLANLYRLDIDMSQGMFVKMDCASSGMLIDNLGSFRRERRTRQTFHCGQRVCDSFSATYSCH